MIKISKTERQALASVGLLQDRRVGHNPCDANYTVANREHCGRDKTIYVTESPEIMAFLGKYNGLNLQPIGEHQVNKLLEMGEISNDNIQHWGEFKTDALVYQDYEGHWRMKRLSKLMIALGFWRTNPARHS